MRSYYRTSQRSSGYDGLITASACLPLAASATISEIIRKEQV